ncbi:MAG: hypothetical protein ACYS22_12395, partial [Planctomycetota bacterium]
MSGIPIDPLRTGAAWPLPDSDGAAARDHDDAAEAAPAVARGTSAPIRPIITATPPGPIEGARRPIDPAVYGPILEEARTADWSGVGIEPQRYIDDRFNHEKFIEPLLADPEARVVLHRDALKIGQVRSIDGSRTINVAHSRAKDYPGRVYYDRDTKAYHVVGIAGEDWFRQTLHMLANKGVGADRIDVEGVFAPEAVIAEDLAATLDAHDFDSVTIGTMGELSRAVERVLRERVRPAHEAKVLNEMGTFLEERAGTARPDRRPRWEERATRLQAVRAIGGEASEQLAAIEADPVLRGVLAEHLRHAKEGPGARELPWSYTTRGGDLVAHRVLEVDDKKHLLVHIGGAHGDLAYHTVRHVLEREPDLEQVNMYGSCGSFSDQIPPDTFITPQTAIRSAEEDREPVEVTNAASLEGAVEVAHSNVSTLLREHH